MKRTFISLSVVLAMTALAQAADVTVTISGVHMCCGKCTTGAEAAVAAVPGASATANKEARTVELRGADTAVVQKAADALVKAGFFGTSSDPKIKLKASKAPGKTVQSLQVAGVHLCCDKCAKAAHEAVATVAGVKADTAAKGATQFEVTGEFKDQDVLDALHKAGLAGKPGK